MRSLVHVVARNSIIALISRLAIKFISFAFIIWIARSLGEAEFGHYALVWSYVTIFAMLSDLGLGMYIIREMARKRQENNYLAENVIVFRLILAVFTIGIIILWAMWLDYSSTLIAHISLATLILLLYAVQDPLDSVLQANERIDISSVLRMVGQVVFVLVGLLFLKLGWGITGLILAALIQVGVITVLTWRQVVTQCRKLQWRLQPRLWLKLVAVALPFGLIGFAINWSQKIDTVILSLFWPTEEIGWYNAAYNLVLGVGIISNSFNVALYPTLSKEHNSQLKMSRFNSRIVKYLFLASLPLAASLAILSKSIVSLLYGANYAPSASVLAILAWTIPFLFFSEFFRYQAMVANKEWLAVVAIVVAVISNVVLNLIFIPRYGAVAAAFTTVFTEATLVALFFGLLRANISFQAVGGAFWRPAVASLFMSVVLWLVGFMPLVLVVIVGIATYVGSLALMGEFGSDDWKWFDEVRNRSTAILN